MRIALVSLLCHSTVILETVRKAYKDVMKAHLDVRKAHLEVRKAHLEVMKAHLKCKESAPGTCPLSTQGSTPRTSRLILIFLNDSFIELEIVLWKDNNTNLAATDQILPVNNLAHSPFKQITVRLNGTLISPRTDTYHHKAFI